MNLCLSERALERLWAGGGRDAERAHLEACAACAARYRRVGAALETVGYVLLETEEPERRGPAPRRWLFPAAVAATALVAVAALWTTVAVRPPGAPSSRAVPTDETLAYLRDVSVTMFSAEDRPAGTLSEPLVAALESPAGEDRGCDWPDWAVTTGCDDDEQLLDLFSRPDTDG